MYRKQVTDASPMRILERSIHGGVGPGNLGVVMARAGVGKTALLVRIGIDHTLRDRSILHVTLDQSLEHTMGWYDALFEDLELRTHLEEPHSVRDHMRRKRLIQAFPDRQLSPDRLRKVADLYGGTLAFRPSAILIDGYDWEGNPQAADEIRGFKSIAGELDAELWMSAQTHREDTDDILDVVPPPCADCQELIDVALFLEPQGAHVAIRLVKDHGEAVPPETHLELDPDSMRLLSDHAALPRLPVQSFTLLSGGYIGAEEAFGAAAERWGVQETNFSFGGRKPSRRISVVELSEEALRKGHVSRKYIESHLHRTFPDTAEWRRILDTIWHEVSTAGQVFVIGIIQPDGTVRGGTGWAAELAKHFHKPLFVFDQEESAWKRWDGVWADCDPPVITARRFCGTGTRHLTEAARIAIDQLFTRSFEN